MEFEFPSKHGIKDFYKMINLFTHLGLFTHILSTEYKIQIQSMHYNTW